MKHLLHHVKTRVPLVVARDPEPKLLVDVDGCLQVFMLMLMLAMMDILMVVEIETMIDMVTFSLWVVGSKVKLLVLNVDCD